MSVAKLVQAESLNVALVVGSTNSSGRPRVPFFGDAPANSDIVEARIFSDAASCVSELLNLTPYQAEILALNALSVTAHRFTKFQGIDGLIVVSSSHAASMMLHSLGFVRRSEHGTLVSPSFIKVFETNRGSVAVATARVEREGAFGCVYVSLSVDVNTSSM